MEDFAPQGVLKSTLRIGKLMGQQKISLERKVTTKRAGSSKGERLKEKETSLNPGKIGSIRSIRREREFS